MRLEILNQVWLPCKVGCNGWGNQQLCSRHLTDWGDGFDPIGLGMNTHLYFWNERAIPELGYWIQSEKIAWCCWNLATKFWWRLKCFSNACYMHQSIVWYPILVGLLRRFSVVSGHGLEGWHLSVNQQRMYNGLSVTGVVWEGGAATDKKIDIEYQKQRHSQPNSNLHPGSANRSVLLV